MDVYRIIELFKGLMNFFPDERAVILEVVKKDFLGEGDIILSYFTAKNIGRVGYEELQKESPIFAKISFMVFHTLFNGQRADICEYIMEGIMIEKDESDIDLAFNILELVEKTEGEKDDKFRAVLGYFKSRLRGDNEIRALLEELRKYVK